MGIRYQSLFPNPEKDPLRPKNIDSKCEDHLECKNPPYVDFRQLHQSYDYNKEIDCCQNVCVFCIYNLTLIDDLSDDVQQDIKKFKNKALYIIYIVQKKGCKISIRLDHSNLDLNGIIMTESQYKRLMKARILNKTILEKAKEIQEEYTSGSESDESSENHDSGQGNNPNGKPLNNNISYTTNSSVYKSIRNHMGNTIYHIASVLFTK